MARRMKGIYRRGNVWWACYKNTYGRVVRVSTGKTDYSEAVTFLNSRRTEIDKGNEPETKKIPNYTFRDLKEEYLKWCTRQRSHRSKKGFIEQLSIFDDLPLRHFTTKLIEQFQSERLVKGLKKVRIDEEHFDYPPNKPATINRLVATLKHMFTKAVEWDMVEENTLKKVRRAKLLPENNRRLRYLSREEIQNLLRQCTKRLEHLRPIVITALNTGMRKGEILSLKWDNVDLKHGFILLDVTKNGERREIPINGTMRNALSDLPTRFTGGYVFADKGGNPYQDIKHSFATACKNAGIRDFRFHDLRHTFASHLVMSGQDITTVKELMGHKTLTMTLRYAHLAPSHKVRAVDALDVAINGEPTSQSLHSKAL